MGDPPTASTQLTARASRPHSEAAFFGSGVSRFPEKEGGRPAHGIDSAHNEGESPSLRGRFFWVECESIPRKGGWATRPRHRLTSQRGRVALLGGRFFGSGVSRFPEKEGGRPAHGIDAPHNEGESPSLLLTSGVPVARASVTTSNHPPTFR